MKLSSLQKGLVGSWNLDQQSYNPATKRFSDATPYENNGISVNAANFGTDRMGQANRSTIFNGTSDYVVRIPDSASLSPTSAMTAMVWIKGDLQGGGRKSFFTHYDSGILERAWTFHSNNVSPYNEFEIFLSGDGSWSTGHQKLWKMHKVVLDNTWHLVGFTFDAGTLKPYVDGVEITNITKGTNNLVPTLHNSTADVMIGCSLSSNIPSGLFNGNLSGAKMWNRALSQTEITARYEQYNSKVIL